MTTLLPSLPPSVPGGIDDQTGSKYYNFNYAGW